MASSANQADQGTTTAAAKLDKRYASLDRERTAFYTIGSVTPQEASDVEEACFIVCLPWRDDHQGSWHQFLARGSYPVRMTRVPYKARSGFRVAPIRSWGGEFYDFAAIDELGTLYEQGDIGRSTMDQDVEDLGPDPLGPPPHGPSASSGVPSPPILGTT